MKQLFGLLATLLSFHLLAGDKSLDLDLQKAQVSQEECLRLQQYRPQSGLQVHCRDDHHLYLSQAQAPVLKSGDKLKIGNFNLLHPGMDKTLFKDFALVAELINNEFDVMAGIELIDVLSDDRAANILMRPTLKLLYDAYLKAKVEHDADLSHVDQDQINARNLQLQQLQTQYKNQLQHIAGLKTQQLELEQVIADIERGGLSLSQLLLKNAKPGFTILGWEPFRNRRLQRLERFRQLAMARSKLVSAISSMQQELLRLSAQISEASIPLPSTGPSNERIVQLNQARAALELQARQYKIPGYLRLLNELRKLDASWSLVLSPFGDALEESHTQELSGFFFRNGRVNLKNNAHCGRKQQRPSAACYPDFSPEWAGMFSRRPFLSTFDISGREYTLLASHVIFTSPPDEETKANMLDFAFGTTNMKTLGKGINNDNYARFIEVKGSLELMKELETEGLQQVIYMGDLNLETSLAFWKSLLAPYPGLVVKVDQKSSLTLNRFAGSTPTLGLSNDYDHFIFDAGKIAHCQQAGTVDFINGAFAEKIKAKYQVRVDGAKAPYATIEDRDSIYQQRAQELLSFSVASEADLPNFNARVFESQFKDTEYYKFFQQIISDHLPIQLTCTIP